MPLPNIKKVSAFQKKSLYKGPTKEQRKKIKKLGRKLLYIGIVGTLAGFILFAILVAWYSKDLPDPNNLQERAIAQSTQIYDRTGEHLLYEIHGDQNRTLVKLEELPEYVVWATLVLEDRNFYSHHGFNLKGVLRSLISNIFRGTKVGGSTITQQFVKNSILSPEKTYTRKLKELILSVQIERKFTKDQILQLYLNEIPYGSTNYGIEAASQSYFGHSARELTLAEAATLAALPQSPTYYLNEQDVLKGRRDYALDQMAELGYITQEEADAAKAEEFKIRPRVDNIQAAHFVFYVKQVLTEKYGERAVEQGGMKVISTLDYEKQEIAERAVREQVESKGESLGLSNGALVAIDPKTGQLLAMVGSKDFFDEEIDGQVNVALSPRQPGSSFKPFVYTQGFIEGYTPDTILWDVFTSFKTAIKPYEPHNYDGAEHGPITVRTALQGSLNIPAVKMLYLAGIDDVLDFAEKLGYTTFGDRSRFGLSLVLGGGEVKLLEHTAAYGVLAAEGKKHDITPILKVEDSWGKTLEEWKENEGTTVLSPEISRTITNVLSDNNARAYVFGTGSYLQLGERPVAAKTGTTNDYRDGWTLGYTPSLVAGVWVGNNDNSEMHRGVGGSVGAAPIWNQFMREALEGSEIEYFTAPPANDANKAVLTGKSAEETVVRIDRASGKLATEYTPETYVEEKTYRDAHCILYYVDKDNPRGPAPSNPAIDPQYENWETAVQKWVEEKGGEYVAEKPPTDYDDLHVPENKPYIQIMAPENNTTLNSRTVYVEATASAPRGISRIEYWIDDVKIGTTWGSDHDASLQIPNLVSKGFHNLIVKAFDDIDNNESDQITVNLLADKLPLDISFSSPANGDRFYQSEFPVNISASLTDISDIKKLDFYYGENSHNGALIASVVGVDSTYQTISWNTAPRVGTYKLWAEAVDTNDQKLKSETITIHIE